MVSRVAGHDWLSNVRHRFQIQLLCRLHVSADPAFSNLSTLESVFKFIHSASGERLQIYPLQSGERFKLYSLQSGERFQFIHTGECFQIYPLCLWRAFTNLSTLVWRAFSTLFTLVWRAFSIHSHWSVFKFIRFQWAKTLFICGRELDLKVLYVN